MLNVWDQQLCKAISDNPQLPTLAGGAVVTVLAETVLVKDASSVGRA